MTSITTVLLLVLVAAVNCLPPPSPRSYSFPDTPSHHEIRDDHRLDLLGLSGKLRAAVAPLLDGFLLPIVESLPEDYLENLAEAIKKETSTKLDSGPLTHGAQYFEDEDNLQLHEDFKTNIISNEE